ncbi:hypothetical protein FB451DRAFT_1195659 [Mycena latifolia]|nr:hypothetical protein FB451DRAFT_1195659 [Mycena latifolia]
MYWTASKEWREFNLSLGIRSSTVVFAEFVERWVIAVVCGYIDNSTRGVSGQRAPHKECKCSQSLRCWFPRKADSEAWCETEPVHGVSGTNTHVKAAGLELRVGWSGSELAWVNNRQDVQSRMINQRIYERILGHSDEI